MTRYIKSEAKEYVRRHLTGVVSAICVPEKAGEIDEPGLRHDVRHCLDVIGAGGLYLHGFYGNFWLLTSAERKRVLSVVIDEAGGRLPVICRCAHQSMRDAIELVRHAEWAGADVISLLGPLQGQASDLMVYRWFELIAAETRLAISVFNTAQVGYVMSPALLARISTIENVAALKNHVAPEHTAEVRRLVGDSIAVVDPDEDRFLASMLEHGQTAIYTGTNYMYDGPDMTPMRDYVAAGLAGDREVAVKLFQRMKPLRDLHARVVIEPWVATGLCPIATVKFWSQLRGMTGGPVRPPLPELSADEREALERDLEIALRLTASPVT